MPDEKSHGLCTQDENHVQNNMAYDFQHLWVKKLRHSETISDEKCYLYRSMHFPIYWRRATRTLVGIAYCSWFDSSKHVRIPRPSRELRARIVHAGRRRDLQQRHHQVPQGRLRDLHREPYLRRRRQRWAGKDILYLSVLKGCSTVIRRSVACSWVFLGCKKTKGKQCGGAHGGVRFLRVEATSEPRKKLDVFRFRSPMSGIYVHHLEKSWG